MAQLAQSLLKLNLQGFGSDCIPSRDDKGRRSLKVTRCETAGLQNTDGRIQDRLVGISVSRDVSHLREIEKVLLEMHFCYFEYIHNRFGPRNARYSSVHLERAGKRIK